MFEKGSFQPVQATKLVDDVVNQIQQKFQQEQSCQETNYLQNLN